MFCRPLPSLQAVKLGYSSQVPRYICPRCSSRLASSLAGHSKRIATSSIRNSPLLTSPRLRHASTAKYETRTILTRLRNILYSSALSLTLLLDYFYLTDTRSAIHQLTPNLLRYAYDDAEDAHEVGNKWLRVLYKFGLHPRERNAGSIERDGKADIDLSVEIFGHELASPIGTSAGIDKLALIPDALFALGASIVEVGGATPLPQDGNERPRVWRIGSQKGLVNRYGLNSEGSDHMAMVLRERMRGFAYKLGYGVGQGGEQEVLDGGAGVPPGSLTKGKLLAVQIAKNKSTDERDVEAVKRDYVYCVNALAKYADIVVVNVSSPNTPGLRSLQSVEPLTSLLTAVTTATAQTPRRTKPAVMVKVSPDEDSEEQVRGICTAVMESGVDGIIVGNTTKSRPAPFPEGYSLSQRERIALAEQGGYSGPQLFERTVKLVARYRRVLDEAVEDEKSTSEQSGDNEESTGVARQIEQTVERDEANLKPATSSNQGAQPLIRFPERHSTESESSSSSSGSGDTPALSSSSHIDQLPSNPTTGPHTPKPKRMTIFATGGITNGAQAFAVLEAGADVAQVYTALVYGGAGTMTRMKTEMREEMRKRLRDDPKR